MRELGLRRHEGGDGSNQYRRRDAESNPATVAPLLPARERPQSAQHPQTTRQRLPGCLLRHSLWQHCDSRAASNPATVAGLLAHEPRETTRPRWPGCLGGPCCRVRQPLPDPAAGTASRKRVRHGGGLVCRGAPSNGRLEARTLACSPRCIKCSGRTLISRGEEARTLACSPRCISSAVR